MDVRDLDVEPEDLVVVDLQGRNAGALALGGLEGGDPVPSARAEIGEFVEFGIEAPADHPALLDGGRHLVGEGSIEQVDAGREVGQRFRGPPQDAGVGLVEFTADRREDPQTLAEPDEFPRARPPGRDAGEEALDVLDAPELEPQPVAEALLGVEFGDPGLAVADRVHAPERLQQPTPQTPGPHRGQRPVEHREEGAVATRRWAATISSEARGAAVEDEEVARRN